LRILDLIINKRNRQEHTVEEIQWLVQAFTGGNIPDYQMAAWLMAVYFQGMTDNETAALTMAMAQSGEVFDLSGIPGKKVDKHSTGGVADTTTLVVAPLVAAAGTRVAKMSGRGLGFTGGTIDKLEAIPGFNTTLTREAFEAAIRRHGLAVIAQSKDIAPADGKMYSLRDVTGTIESIPLIASSVMSKKIAAGADTILLDVKVGSGAFMKQFEDAVKLAQIMVSIGQIVNRETVAIISSMEEPLGSAIGNSLEVQEAIDILSGKGSSELRHVCLTLGAHMLRLAGEVTDLEVCYSQLAALLDRGDGLQKFAEFIKSQGGNPAVIENRELLPQAQFSVELPSRVSGYIRKIQSAQVGYAAVMLGAGRMYKNQPIDLGAGIILRHRIGDFVQKGQSLATVFFNNQTVIDEVIRYLKDAFEFSDIPVKKPPVILGIVRSNGIETYSE
jgi:pyrimidine-nucleoside phosphorylase